MKSKRYLVFSLIFHRRWQSQTVQGGATSRCQVGLGFVPGVEVGKCLRDHLVNFDWNPKQPPEQYLSTCITQRFRISGFIFSPF